MPGGVRPPATVIAYLDVEEVGCFLPAVIFRRWLTIRAASYYIQASETGGEPPGRWWGPGARALGFKDGQRVERKPYDLLFGERQAPDGTPVGRSPTHGRKAADLYIALLAAEPHATAERQRELRTAATRQARQSPLSFDLTISLSSSIFHASLGENARLAREAGNQEGEFVALIASYYRMLLYSTVSCHGPIG